MARIKQGSTLGDLRGKLGSQVVSSNASGGYIKGLVPPSKVRTANVQPVRLTFRDFVRAYSALPEADREYWRDWAALPAQARLDYWGDPYYLTGQQQFIAVNQVLYTGGQPQLDTPPVGGYPASPPVVSVVLAGSGSVDPCDLTYGALGADTLQVHFFGQVFHGLGRLSATGTFRFLLALTEAAGDTVDIKTMLEGIFGSLPDSFTLFGQWYSMSSEGLRSPVNAGRWSV